MDQGPLVSEMIEAGARFLPEYDKYAPLVAAFWLKDSDSGNWNLWLASKKVTDRNFDVAYGEVIRLARGMGYPAVDAMQVRVARMYEKEVKAVLAEQARRGAAHPFRLWQEVASGAYFEEAYVYPALVPATAAS
jgi:hypothetical protein